MNITGKKLNRTLLAGAVISVFALVAVFAIVRPDVGESTVVAGTNTAPANSGFANQGIFAKITANGEVLDGYVGTLEIGGMDVTDDYAQLIWAGFSAGVPVGDDGTLGIGRLIAEPFTIVKSIDGMTTPMFRAMVQNQNVDAEVLIFGTDPDGGNSRLEFIYTMTGARIVSQRINSSENSPNSAGEFTDTETIAIAFHTIRLTDAVNSTEFEYSWNELN